MATARPRVVFVPGTMGSVLVDTSLNRDPDAAERACRENLGPWLTAASTLSAIDFCKDEKPAVIWGKYGMLHWLLDTDEWVARLTTGNGIDRSSTAKDRVGTDIIPPSPCPRQPARSSMFGEDPVASLLATLAQHDRFPELASLTVNLALLTIPISLATAIFADPITEDQVRMDPYGDFLNQLCADGADLLVFPYDWRLSNAFNATRLAAAIHRKWWRRTKPNDVGPDTIPLDERVTIVAHSMGGLLARFYIEAETADVGYISDRAARKIRLAGHRYVRQLITVATPHLGAPLAYTSFVGASDNFEESTVLKYLRRMSGNTSVDVSGLPLSEKDQRTLAEHYSSLIELFPVYRFMPRENTDQLLDTDAELAATYKTAIERSGKTSTVKPMLHSSRNWAWRMLAEFRRHLVPAPCLDYWLVRNGLTYTFASGDDYTQLVRGDWVGTTVSAYDGRTGKVDVSARGDGVVPWKSAALYPYIGGADHIQWIPVRGSGWDHQRLLQHPTVRAACIELVRNPPPLKRLPLHRLSRDDLQDLVEQLLKAMGYGGRSPRAVISVVSVEFRDPVDSSLIPFRSGGQGWVVEPHRLPAGAIYCRPDSKEYVCRLEHGKIGPRQFVAIRNVFDDPTKALVMYGGVLFLPESACGRTLDVLTWNVGTMGDLQRSATNETHSEQQLALWFTTWFDRMEWNGRVAALSIRNERLSPCSQCVADLTSIGRLLGDRVSRCIAWSKLYDTTTGAGPTDLAEVGKLRANWEIEPRSPMPTR